MQSNHNVTAQNKSNSFMSAATIQSKLQKSGASLMDNRPQAIVQRKLNAVNKSNLASEGDVIQAKSKVKTNGQGFIWGQNWGQNNNTIVGQSMKAWLDPSDPLRGESASVNTNQDNMMHYLRDHYVINGGDIVKGHLLNDNLGGKALNNNLFPITRAANKQHLLTTENYAKTELWTNNTPIWYSINVIGAPTATQNLHRFDVALGPWDKTNDQEHPGIAGSITSNLGAPRDMDGANLGDMDTHSAESLKNAMSHGRALQPHTGVFGMDDNERHYRDHAGLLTYTEHDNTGYTAAY